MGLTGYQWLLKSRGSFCDWQEVADNQSWTINQLERLFETAILDLHVVHVTLNSERKAAFDLWVLRRRIWIFERTAGQNGLLVVVERNLAEFLPV